MKPLDRNISILEHIVSYCQQIEQTVASDQGHTKHCGTQLWHC